MVHQTFKIPVETSAPGGQTTTYYVEGNEPVLIDPAGTASKLTNTIEANGLAHIVVTHSHRDHVGGVKYYAEKFDGEVWAKYGRQARFSRATGVEPTKYFVEGTRIGSVTVIEIPGHAPDHVGFIEGNSAFTGDAAVETGSVFVGKPDGDMRAYLTSLRRMVQLPVNVLYPGHGAIITKPRETIKRLIRHRLDREQKVLTAVESGATTLDQIVNAAYHQDLTGIRDLAERSVESHLEKLAVEGKVRVDGTKWCTDDR